MDAHFLFLFFWDTIRSMILLDGKKIAERMLIAMKDEMSATARPLRLAVVVVGDDPIVQNFIAQKKKAGVSVGIETRVYPFSADITTNELRKRIAEIVHEKKNTGVIIQLPLPPHINRQYILNAIPPEKDPDVLSSRALGNFAVGKSVIVPPVSGGIKMLLEEYHIEYRDKAIVILGAGALVGRPTALWLMAEGIGFTLVTERTAHPEVVIREADIVISGIGRPRYIGADMIKEGAVLIDAGTSESAGEIVGDVDSESVASRASHLAPVPGGIGPLTVVMLFKNLITLAKL